MEKQELKNFEKVLPYNSGNLSGKKLIIIISVFVIFLIKAIFLILLNDKSLLIDENVFFLGNIQDINYLQLISMIVVVFLATSLRFSIISCIKKSFNFCDILKESFKNCFRVLYPIILFSVILFEILIFDEIPYGVFFLLGLLFYFLIVFASLSSLMEKRKGIDVFIKTFYVFKKDVLSVISKSVIYTVVSFLLFVASFYIFINVADFSNLIIGFFSSLVFLSLFFSFIDLRLSMFFENLWEKKKNVAYYTLYFPYVVIINVFLLIIIFALILMRTILKQ